ncbi:tumor necrosis factor receptor superfamily member 6B-like isoform X2 [Cheilinus undulatus]|uniref:tumor necrosis factor receptor superfamily member 6B-like isoform X2 n=1 Tax=Cheilinus undulatus TaxID=241271 RepID=UPI001BD63DC3|nr:tumor necrosis factor receptor superfamily member 6B-like isoform X2 [Cheilinus undulatus]
MHTISMILPALLLFTAVSLCESDPTYERHDPHSGETLLCTMCPPGTHMSAHCTATTPTKCEPCRNNHYTELWNYLSRCLYCSTFCLGNMEVEKECTNVSDRVCRCKEGFYWTHDICVRHTECGPGHGVNTKGTSRTNTNCARCTEGTFSNSSSALETCINHQTCASGQIVLVPGTVYHDTVCGTCEGLENEGETLRTFFQGFLTTHKMPIPKIRKFVSRYILRSAEERRPRHRSHLMDNIRAWLAEATHEQLRQLPGMLRAVQLTSLLEKLETRLNEIKQQSPNCHLSL